MLPSSTKWASKENSDVLLSTENVGLQDKLLPLGMVEEWGESKVKERVNLGGGLGS